MKEETFRNKVEVLNYLPIIIPVFLLAFRTAFSSQYFVYDFARIPLDVLVSVFSFDVWAALTLLVHGELSVFWEEEEKIRGIISRKNKLWGVFLIALHMALYVYLLQLTFLSQSYQNLVRDNYFAALFISFFLVWLPPTALIMRIVGKSMNRARIK